MRLKTTRRRRRIAVLAVGLVVGFSALLLPTTAFAQSLPKIDVLGQDTLVVNAESKKDTATTYLSVLNEGTRAAKITVTFQASSLENVVGIDHSSGPTPVPPGEAKRVPVVLTGLTDIGTTPIDGQLVVHGGRVPAARALTVIPAPQPITDWAKALLIGAGIASVLLAVIVAASALLKKGWKQGLQSLGGPAPGPEWGLDRWATSLAAITAIFATVIGTITLPPVPSQISKATLLQLNLFFGAVIIVGPFIFQAVRDPRANLAMRKRGLWGFSPVLLVSYAVTAGAVLGELASLALLMWEVVGGGTAGVLAIGAVVLLAALAGWYFIVIAFQQVTENWKERANQADQDAQLPQKVVLDSDALPVWVSHRPRGAGSD
jgi:hypothetical protein